MSGKLTAAEALEFLRAVESGAVTLEPESEPQMIYAGNVEYEASNGWTIVVFNDCNEWDYIDTIEAADGRRAEGWADGGLPELDAYQPPAGVAWERYRIPGYLSYRCMTCGVHINNGFEGETGRCEEHALPSEPVEP